MALIDKASLLMVPSTYEAGKLYNVLPSGNRAPDNKGGAGYDQTRADFDFDRGSNAAATRINSSGLIEKYRENLLTQSNNFSDSDWSKTGIASVTGGEVGYDGSNDAYLITASASTTNHYLRQSGAVQSGVQTYSVYAKGNGYDVQLRATGVGGTTNWVSFNLISGSVGTSGAGIIESKMTSLGNGWYRCSTSFNDSGSPFIGIYMVEDADTAGSGPSYTGDGVSGIFLQNAQVESSLVATDYLNSTSVTAKAGVLVDMPRINYDANGENGALLLEPSRQQLIQYSEYFGGWDLSNSTITNNATTSPEGVDNASLYTSSNATNYVKDIITAANGTYTLSAFFKRDATDNVQMNLSDGVTGEIRYVFNLADETSTLTKSGGTISGYSADFENYGNGWYRLHITATTNSGTAITAYFETDNETGSFYVFGAQLESNASYVSSYIPNHGTSGGVTRAADSCSVTGASDVIGQSEGTMFLDFVYNGKSNITADNLNLALGTWPSNIITIGQYNATLYARIYASSVINFFQTFGVMTIGQRYKCAIAYANNDAVFYVNGALEGSDTSVIVPAVSSVSLNRGVYENSKQINQALLFKTRLSNEELAALTTL